MDTMTKTDLLRFRVRLTVQALVPAIVLFVVLLAFCWIAGAHWPQHWTVSPPKTPPDVIEQMRQGHYVERNGRDDVIVFALAVAFLFTKATVMIRQMSRPVDRLALSLAAANVFFTLLYGFALFSILFPLWFATHYEAVDTMRDTLRWGLNIVLAWAIVTLSSTPTKRQARSILRRAEAAQ